MSVAFYTASPRPPSLRELEDFAEMAGWRCDDAPADMSPTAPLFDDYIIHPYIHATSARGIELHHAKGVLETRILACSSAADYQLALTTIARHAARHAVSIRHEDGRWFTAKQFAASFDAAWIATETESVTTMTAATVKEHGLMTLPGCRRHFHLGPRFLATLRARMRPFATELISAICHVQFIDLETPYHAFPIYSLNHAPGETIALFVPDRPLTIPHATRIGLKLGEDWLEVPYAVVPELVGERWNWIDECQGRVDPIVSADWPALIERAREHALG